MDDALHCIQLNENTFEVGVHIADVSYFVQENTLIDRIASERATSVYLVQKVIPMLPRLLCEELCSLNPAVDRLTFSVIWKINSDGEVGFLLNQPAFNKLNETYLLVFLFCYKKIKGSGRMVRKNSDKLSSQTKLRSCTGIC